MKKFEPKYLFKPKNKIQFDATGEEIEFPELDVNDTPDVGDKIIIDNKTNLSGERLMPNGETIVFENGVITEIIETDLMNNLKKEIKAFKRLMGIENNEEKKQKRNFEFKRKPQ